METPPLTSSSKMDSREKMKQDSGNTNIAKDEVRGRKEENSLDKKFENNVDEEIGGNDSYNNLNLNLKTDEEKKSIYYNTNVAEPLENNLPTKRCLRERKCKPNIQSPSPSLSGSSLKKSEEKVTPPRNPLKKRILKLKKPSPVSTQPCSSKTANIMYPNVEETVINDNSLSTTSVDETAIFPVKQDSVASLALSKMNFDSIEIDNDVEDIYTKKPPFSPKSEVPDTESPETKRRRLDKENMVIARQCRLHPANKKYNQGPVVNPPLMSPGTLVGYTPAGQRHEVNLNFQRPTWFNSEYARMQFDDATRINVRRMFNELENGMFLPDSLDSEAERRYNAERDLAEMQATEKFNKIMEGIKKKSNEILELFEDEADLRFLEAEQQMLELNEFATVKLEDFPTQLAEKLKHALTIRLDPLIFKKHPIILETLQKLTRQCFSLQVAKSAQALLDKIEHLFDVPESKTFMEHFESEVEILKKKTKDMDWCDILIMSKEPTVPCPPEETIQNEAESPSGQEACMTESNVDESSEEWIPVDDDDEWEDITGCTDDESFGDPDTSSNDEDTDDESEQSDEENDNDNDDEYSDDDLFEYDLFQPVYEQDSFNLLEGDHVVGMTIIRRLQSGYFMINSFHYV